MASREGVFGPRISIKGICRRTRVSFVFSIRREMQLQIIACRDRCPFTRLWQGLGATLQRAKYRTSPRFTRSSVYHWNKMDIKTLSGESSWRKTELLLTRQSHDIFAVRDGPEVPRYAGHTSTSSPRWLGGALICRSHQLCRSMMSPRGPDLQLTPGLGVYRRRKPSWTIWDLAALKAYSGRC
ncbi:hypothetical protein NDU88_009911 [Pleurodeles waltl]|uniref:Uncharacterized protein n=1 Tax=Pleurodeles waltl TaxID=8319 RepID=A0AAV7PWG5_PLEWA|nr:hypothetical protein NDU88_009911 [Pleurodeles waltl]